jgi:hypothetical protein
LSTVFGRRRRLPTGGRLRGHPRRLRLLLPLLLGGTPPWALGRLSQTADLGVEPAVLVIAILAAAALAGGARTGPAMDLEQPAEVEPAAIPVRAPVGAAKCGEGRTAPGRAAKTTAHHGGEAAIGRELERNGCPACETAGTRRQRPASNRAGIESGRRGRIGEGPRLQRSAEQIAMYFADIAEWRRMGGGCQAEHGDERGGGTLVVEAAALASGLSVFCPGSSGHRGVQQAQPPPRSLRKSGPLMSAVACCAEGRRSLNQRVAGSIPARPTK